MKVVIDEPLKRFWYKSVGTVKGDREKEWLLLPDLRTLGGGGAGIGWMCVWVREKGRETQTDRQTQRANPSQFAKKKKKNVEK